jgi:hypothetical protein
VGGGGEMISYEYIQIGCVIFTGYFLALVLIKGGWFNWIGLALNTFSTIKFVSELIEKGALK